MTFVEKRGSHVRISETYGLLGQQNISSYSNAIASSIIFEYQFHRVHKKKIAGQIKSASKKIYRYHVLALEFLRLLSNQGHPRCYVSDSGFQS